MAYSNAVKNATTSFFNKYGADIVSAITDTGLFLAAVIGQKALESGWGKSDLAAKYNNFGGIKNFGHLPHAGTVLLDTTEVVNGKEIKTKQPFAVFDTPKISFQEYVKILQDPTKKYTSMGVFTADTPENQILLMAKAGYTTTNATKYLKSMQSIIDAALDIYQIGRISTAVKEPTVVTPAAPAANNWMGVINNSLGIDNTYVKPVTNFNL